jgi:CubicO group peptidase (beta-lactamase class C family)
MRFASLLPFAASAMLAGLSPAQAGPPTCAAPPAGGGWSTAAPAAEGLDAARLCAMVPLLAAQKQDNVHAVLVARHGKLVFEQYFSGIDESWGRSLGEVPHGRDQLHDARSVTKSVVALVLGIALDRGVVKARLDTPVFDLLPQYADLRTSEKAKIKLRDLLTMSAGLQWDEAVPYGTPQNSETQMDQAPDPARYVLSQAVVAPAGEVYNYSGGSAVLLQAILKQATGKPLDVVTRELLFAPLGITDVDWIRYPKTGEPIAASGLRLLPRDFAKIGQLVLQHGMWNGRQLVPAAFVDQATTPQINGLDLYFYGYQFWLGRSLVAHREVDWIAAVGLGGQRIFVVPSLDLVAVVNAGLYNSARQAWVPPAILDRYILPAALPR